MAKHIQWLNAKHIIWGLKFQVLTFLRIIWGNLSFLAKISLHFLFFRLPLIFFLLLFLINKSWGGQVAVKLIKAIIERSLAFGSDHSIMLHLFRWERNLLFLNCWKGKLVGLLNLKRWIVMLYFNLNLFMWSFFKIGHFRSFNTRRLVTWIFSTRFTRSIWIFWL